MAKKSSKASGWCVSSPDGVILMQYAKKTKKEATAIATYELGLDCLTFGYSIIKFTAVEVKK